jgi:hypothetical protein
VFERVRATVIDDFRAQYTHFDAEAQAYYEAQITAAGSAWNIDDPAYSAGWLTDAAMIANPKYPYFTALNKLGLSGEIDKLPNGLFQNTPITLATSASSPDALKPTWSILRLHPLGGTGWTINMSKDIKASEILTE